MKVKYIGRHKRVVNVGGIFEKDKVQDVDDEIGKILIKSDKEFVQVDGGQKPPVKEK